MSARALVSCCWPSSCCPSGSSHSIPVIAESATPRNAQTKNHTTLPSATAQHRKRLKQNRHRRGKQHRRQRHNHERAEQRKKIETRIFAQKNLHHDGGDGENQNHRGQHREVADKFSQRVRRFRQRRRRQHLSDAGLPVAIDRAFHDVKPDQRNPARRNQRHKRANPRGGVHAAMPTELNHDSPGRRGVPEKHRRKAASAESCSAARAPENPRAAIAAIARTSLTPQLRRHAVRLKALLRCGVRRAPRDTHLRATAPAAAPRALQASSAA